MIASDETVKDYNFREKLYFDDSLNSATFVAFTTSGKEIKEKDKSLIITYIDEKANTELLVQDKILKANDIEVNSTIELQNIINSADDEIKITVLRDNKEVETVSKLVLIDNEYKIGISIYEDITYETNPKIKYKFNDKETGPSGGLTIALSIYNSLVEEDITKGYKIVGTGTIDKDGIVGAIGGVKYKLKGAVKKKADIFLVPSDNYEEAMKEKEKNNYDINIINVSSFDDALDSLSKLNRKN